MKKSLKAGRKGAFTLVELLTVIAIIGILAALLLPALTSAKAKAKRIQCVANLQEIGVAFHIFLHDHDSKLPMEISTNVGGTLEFIQGALLAGGMFDYKHFQAISNELSNPALFWCPTDRARSAADFFASLQNVNISYFVGANADYGQPTSILAGDRNITNTLGSGSVVQLNGSSGLQWTGEMHVSKGNILLADGSVEQLGSAGLQVASAAGPTGPPTIVVPPTSPGSLSPGGPTSGYMAPTGPSSPGYSVPNQSPRGSGPGLLPGDAIPSSVRTPPPMALMASGPSTPSQGSSIPAPAQAAPPPAVMPTTTTNLVAAEGDSLPALDDATNAVAASGPPVQLAQDQGAAAPGNTYWFLLWLLLLLIVLAVLRVYLVRRNQAA
jgi:prepilin-type N-terminal cleavage/methylation domain-containing protein/prepilin-type processing-associated H-X9-DG protein